MTIRFRSTVCHILAVSLLCSLGWSAEETVLEDSFDGKLTRWTTWSGRPKTEDGKLILELDRGADQEGGFANVGIATANESSLNFLKTPIDISLSEITMEGTGSPETSLVDFWLSAERVFDMRQKACLQFYIKGNGTTKVRLYMTPSDGGAVQFYNAVEMQVSPPIKQVAVKLGTDGLALTVEDSSGSQTKEANWGEILNGDLLPRWKAAWEDASPVLLVKATEARDEGNFRVTIDDLKVTTKP